MFRYCIIYLITFSTSFYCSGQTKTIERLKRNIETASDKSEKLAAIFALCDQGYSSHTDTVLAYATIAKDMATDQHDLHNEVQAMFYESSALTTKSLIDTSLKKPPNA